MSSPSEVSSSETEDESVQTSVNPIEDFLYCVSATFSKHSTPDSEANDWLKLLRLVVTQWVIPSFKSNKNKYHSTLKEKTERMKAFGTGFWWSLNFVSELKSIIENHINEIFRYDTLRNKNRDLKLPDFFEENLCNKEVRIKFGETFLSSTV